MNRRALAVTLIVSLALTVAWRWIPLPENEALLQSLPASGAAYQSASVAMSTSERAIYGEATAVKRLYRIGTDDLMVLLVDGARNRHGVHDPAYCFRGGGWTIEEKSAYPLQNGEGALYTMRRGQQTTQALSWFTDGRSQWASPVRYWWTATLRRATLGLSGPEPVLVVVQPAEAVPDWNRLLRLMPELAAL